VGRTGIGAVAVAAALALLAPGEARAGPGAALPALARWTGGRSIEHVVVTDAVRRTMGTLGLARTVTVACWTDEDFDAVLGAADPAATPGGATAAAIWLPARPRRLHLRAAACAELQRLIDAKAATGPGAKALAAALREILRAHGIAGEATASCYAAQLVPIAATFLGLPVVRARSLGSLAVHAARRGALPGAWDARACRDGGRWDLEPTRANLR
jgi:hypothetical protein